VVSLPQEVARVSARAQGQAEALVLAPTHSVHRLASVVAVVVALGWDYCLIVNFAPQMDHS